MSKTSSTFANNLTSHYNAEVIVKEVHDYYGKSIRTSDARSVVPNYFTHFRATYNIGNLPTSVQYYHGLTSHKTDIVINSSSLDGAYFKVNAAPSNALYVVWYNVDGLSLQPSVPNATYIEIPISTGDTTQLVALATDLVINNLYSDAFKVQRNGSKITIITIGMGIIDDSVDFDTGFLFSNTAGTQEIVAELDINYSGTDPYYEGQLLKGYKYDLYSGKFVPRIDVNVDSIDVDLDSTTDSVSIGDEDGDKLEINTDGSINVKTAPKPLASSFYEVTGVVNGITTELMSYTAAADMLLQKVEISGTNIAEYELTIDGITEDKKRTFFGGSLENIFQFDSGLGITSGQIIKVFVVHYRPDPGDFTARIQVLED